MEDFKVDVTLDAGMHARTITLPIPPFTLIGATTRIGLLTGPMRGRFGIVKHIEFYTPRPCTRSSAKRQAAEARADDTALWELARRSRGTPRIANRLLRRVRDFAAVEGNGKLTLARHQGSAQARRHRRQGPRRTGPPLPPTLIDVYEGGPAGIEAIAATMGEERDTLEDVIEPYLLQNAFVTRTRQGRRATKAAYEHLGLKWTPPKRPPPRRHPLQQRRRLKPPRSLTTQSHRPPRSPAIRVPPDRIHRPSSKIPRPTFRKSLTRGQRRRDRILCRGPWCRA